MGLLNPRNLAYLASLALLVAIYLRARAKPTLEVSSLMLFDEVAAPVASSRVLRTDPMFWLELAALGALSMALAGLYIRSAEAAAHHRTRALIFDLGAAMGAREANGTRLDEARRQALEIVAAARPGDNFSVIGYALEATVYRAPTSHLADVRRTIDGLKPAALPARAAAMRAALMRARGAPEIDLFTDHAPASGLLNLAGAGTRVHLHRVGTPAVNLAIVALEPGTVGASPGRVVVRNFSDRPQICEIALDLDAQSVLSTIIMLEPRGQAVLPFGPLKHGGVVQARIVTADALDADNRRWALALNDKPDRALVMSPSPEARDDLARVLLAVNQNLIVTAVDPVKFNLATAPRYRLAVLEDAYDPGIKASARLIIYPPPWLERSPPPSWQLPVVGTVAMAEMQERTNGEQLDEPLALSPARILSLPRWMDVMAHGTGAGSGGSFPLAAFGYDARGAMGMIAFSVNDHLLLDPDKLEALVLTVDMVKRLLAPQDLQVVSTGDSVSVPAIGVARIVAPDGSVSTARADEMGRVRLRPIEAGRYEVSSARTRAVIYANYYDAGESDLSAAPPAPAPSAPGASATASSSAAAAATRVEPIAPWLVAFALAAMLLGSALLTRKAMRWRARDV
ncbi:MAG TPA: VWA domain-containing protein [Candidatus Binataceae bacterium]|nr:VWA domain-containing protein [Candidatus Binataceae bacterium]